MAFFLHSSNRTGKSCSRTGITVHSGIAELFPSSFVNLTWYEISNICIRVAKCHYLNNFSFHFLINLHITYPNPIHFRQIFTALLNMIAISPRLTPYIIITATTQRPNTCTAILLFLLIQIILYINLSYRSGNLWTFQITGNWKSNWNFYQRI